MRDKRMVWCDIETTGLDPNEDVILEVGLRITNGWGEEISQITLPVWNPGWHDLLYKREGKSAEFVRNMHEASGLVAEMMRLEESPIRPLQYGTFPTCRKLVDWLNERVAGQGTIDGKFPMAGSSVRLDRAFLARHMPALDAWFHYRIIDVSSLAEACRILNPDVYEAFGELEKAHRPQEDITNSIASWTFMIDNFLFVED